MQPDWRELCRLAAVEHDTEKLLELARQIEQALAERERSRDRNHGKSTN